MNIPFWKKLSDLFDEKVKKKDFTIQRTEKDVWGSEVVIVDGENIQKYKLETWSIYVPFKQTDSVNDIVCRALKQLIPEEELHLPDKSVLIKGHKYIDGYKSHILSVGWNTQKTSTLQKTYNKRASQPWTDNYPNCMHAEINAIQRLSKRSMKDFSKCHIFIYREGGGSKRLAKPCKACEKAIRNLGITNVRYTGLNSFVYEKYLREE